MGLEDHWKQPADPSIIAKAIQDVAEETIILGDDVSNLLKSNIGEYIIARAQEELKENLTALMTETDPEYIKVLQFNIHLAKTVPQWLEEAINSGRSELELKFNNEGE